ncbi:MAG: hypothetical protein NT069_07805 [Planctomycetota bacterium]|nr:hypothetical protein [Planctomycetota bacterium]
MASAEIPLRHSLTAPHTEAMSNERDTGRSADGNAILVNPAYSDLLNQLNLDTIAAFRQLKGESVRAIDSRETVRLVLPAFACGRGTPSPEIAVYLKRYGKPTWRERVVPWLRFSRPIVGARAEWEALTHFHKLRLPTMEPIAFGEDADGSFVMTRELVAKCDLKQWVAQVSASEATEKGRLNGHRNQLRLFAVELADIVRRMHAAGLHHQDLYLNHVLWCGERADGGPDLRIIDLGRVRRQAKLSRRWILKDLSQLNYSAAGVSCTDRLRFLRAYLGRKLNRSDRRWIGLIRWKSARIAAHSQKHRL